LIAYRKLENLGTKRMVDEASIFEMDKLTQPYTFNNIDMEKGRVIHYGPRGPDPILFGIRGESAEIVKKSIQLGQIPRTRRTLGLFSVATKAQMPT